MRKLILIPFLVLATLAFFSHAKDDNRLISAETIKTDKLTNSAQTTVTNFYYDENGVQQRCEHFINNKLKGCDDYTYEWITPYIQWHEKKVSRTSNFVDGNPTQVSTERCEISYHPDGSIDSLVRYISSNNSPEKITYRMVNTPDGINTYLYDGKTIFQKVYSPAARKWIDLYNDDSITLLDDGYIISNNYSISRYYYMFGKSCGDEYSVKENGEIILWRGCRDLIKKETDRYAQYQEVYSYSSQKWDTTQSVFYSLNYFEPSTYGCEDRWEIRYNRAADGPTNIIYTWINPTIYCQYYPDFGQKFYFRYNPEDGQLSGIFYDEKTGDYGYAVYLKDGQEYTTYRNDNSLIGRYRLLGEHSWEQFVNGEWKACSDDIHILSQKNYTIHFDSIGRPLEYAYDNGARCAFEYRPTGHSYTQFADTILIKKHIHDIEDSVETLIEFYYTRGKMGQSFKTVTDPKNYIKKVYFMFTPPEEGGTWSFAYAEPLKKVITLPDGKTETTTFRTYRDSLINVDKRITQHCDNPYYDYKEYLTWSTKDNAWSPYSISEKWGEYSDSVFCIIPNIEFQKGIVDLSPIEEHSTLKLGGTYISKSDYDWDIKKNDYILYSKNTYSPSMDENMFTLLSNIYSYNGESTENDVYVFDNARYLLSHEKTCTNKTTSSKSSIQYSYDFKNRLESTIAEDDSYITKTLYRYTDTPESSIMTPSEGARITLVGDVLYCSKYAEVYTISGAKIATVEANSQTTLAPGFFIVRSENTSKKIFVR